jgi:hypothetical protein
MIRSIVLNLPSTLLANDGHKRRKDAMSGNRNKSPDAKSTYLESTYLESTYLESSYLESTSERTSFIHVRPSETAGTHLAH